MKKSQDGSVLSLISWGSFKILFLTSPVLYLVFKLLCPWGHGLCCTLAFPVPSQRILGDTGRGQDADFLPDHSLGTVCSTCLFVHSWIWCFLNICIHGLSCEIEIFVRENIYGTSHRIYRSSIECFFFWQYYIHMIWFLYYFFVCYCYTYFLYDYHGIN